MKFFMLFWSTDKTALNIWRRQCQDFFFYHNTKSLVINNGIVKYSLEYYCDEINSYL